MNIFDGLQETMLNVCNTTFGYDASWIPSNIENGPQNAGTDGILNTARVLFKEPTSEYDLMGHEYNPRYFNMEYKDTDFPGLEVRVNNGYTEEVTVNGVKYYVRAITRKWDGKTMICLLESQ